MKHALVAALIASGVMLGTVSTALAASGNLAIILQNSVGTRALNPQPEPPGVTDQVSGANRLQLNPQPEPPGATDSLTGARKLKLNPQPEPPGVAYKKIITASSTECVKAADKAKQKARALAKIAYNKAVQLAIQIKAKFMAAADSKTDAEAKKALILKAQTDYAAAVAKAKQDRNTAYDAADQVYKRTRESCGGGAR